MTASPDSSATRGRGPSPPRGGHRPARLGGGPKPKRGRIPGARDGHCLTTGGSIASAPWSATVRLRTPGAPAAAAKAAAVPAVAARPGPGGPGIEAPSAACGLRLHRAHLLGPASSLALAGLGRRVVHGHAVRQHLAGKKRTELAATEHAGCERLATRLQSAVGGGGLQRRRDLPEEAGHP